MQIRPYRTADQPAVEALLGRLWPDPLEREFFWSLAPRPYTDGFAHDAWVAEQGGDLLGFARLDHNHYLVDPELVFLVVNVRLEATRRGVGTALHDVALARARELGVRRVRTSARSDLADLTRFYAARDYREVMRGGPLLVLDLAELDDPPALPEDIHVEPLAEFLRRPGAVELAAPALNAWSRDIHADLDFPPAADLDPQDWLDTLTDDTDLLPASSLVALRGGELLASAVLGRWQDSDTEVNLNLDLTSTAPQARGPEPKLPAWLIWRSLLAARASGHVRAVVEAQPHFPWIRPGLATIPFRQVERPVWVVVQRRL